MNCSQDEQYLEIGCLLRQRAFAGRPEQGRMLALREIPQEAPKVIDTLHLGFNAKLRHFPRRHILVIVYPELQRAAPTAIGKEGAHAQVKAEPDFRLFGTQLKEVFIPAMAGKYFERLCGLQQHLGGHIKVQRRGLPSVRYFQQELKVVGLFVGSPCNPDEVVHIGEYR